MSTLSMSSATPPAAAARGVTRFSMVRIVLGTLAVALPVALTLILVQQLVDKPMRAYWQQALAAVLCVLGYWLYVRKVERAAMDAFAGGAEGAMRGLGAGLLLGGALFVTVIGILAASGAYHVTGYNAWTVLLKPVTELVLVALIEEILFRAVLQRNLERSLGSWAAIAISSLVFGLAHLPNANVTFAAIGVTVVAGVLFAAAYLVTRRLWLPLGMHFAWNYLSDAVFSIPTSGHPAKGILQGQTSGAQWLSGGAYGVEASLVTLVVLSIASVVLLAAARRRGQLLGRAGARALARA